MNTQLLVKFEDKDGAKNSGAFWNPDLKTWYAPANSDLNNFSKWLPERSIILKPPILVIIGTRECWSCYKPTKVISLGTDGRIEPTSGKMTKWKEKKGFWIYFWIDFLPNTIVKLIQTNHPNFKQVFSKTLNKNYWGNTCEHCNRLQGDYELHMEPDNPFDSFYGRPIVHWEKLIYEMNFPIVSEMRQTHLRK